MFKSKLGGCESRIEAVRRRMGSNHGHRAFAVASEQSLVQVCLLCLGRQAGGRSASLHIHNDERQFGHHRKAESFALERKARAGSGGDSEVAGEGSAYGGAYAGYLILCLQSLAAQALVERELFEYGRCRSNRI